MGPDGYVRLTAPQPRVFGESESPAPILFVDVAPGTHLKRLRDVGATRLHGAGLLVARTRDHTFEELAEVTAALRLNVPVVRITHPLGELPVLEGDHPGFDADDITQRCRAVELTALLHFGNAVWQPPDYHYLLPSGRHAAGFVRLADAIRSPHDAQVLASWLAADVRDGCALIADTDTLTPLLLAVQLSMQQHGVTPGAVHVLDHYPRTQADTDTVIREAGRRSKHLLVVLSVNSSGSLRDRVLHSLELSQGQIDSWSLHILVSNLPVLDGAAGTHWLPLPGSPPLTSQPHGTSCHDCRNPRRSLVVPIDPKTFDGRLPDEVVKKTLSLKDPDENHAFFEICDEFEAVGVEESPAEAVASHRGGKNRMAIRVRFEQLVSREGFAELVRERLGQVDDLIPADLVLVPAHEYRLPGFEVLAERVMPDLVASGAPGGVMEFPVEGEWSHALMQRVAEVSTVTVFALGSVTGRSLQRALVSVQAAKEKPPREQLQGVVVNARPADHRDWTSLRNSYAGRLHPLWLTRVPERSPLTEEGRELEAVDPRRLSEAARELFETRRRLAQGAYSVEDVPLFLGSTTAARLTPHSIYGQQLGAAATFFAVCSAVEARRVEEKIRPPQRLTFDVRAITRSYYDPLILASVLRWLHGPELWWGEDPDAAVATAQEIIARATSEQRGILIPELLLAGALGKVPGEALDVITTHARPLLQKVDDNVPAAVELGLALVKRTT